MVVSQPRPPEPPRSRHGAPESRRGRGACPWSSRERIPKAITAFLVAPLARVDGGCIDLDGPALISTCCHSALAARVATGAPTVTGGHFLRRAQEFVRTFPSDWIRVGRLSGVQRTRHTVASARVCSDLSSSSPVAHKGTHKYWRSGASQVNNLAVTVSLPHVQHASCGNVAVKP